MAKIELPPRLHHARTIRVHSFNCIEVDLELDYGVSIRKKIVLEGIQQTDVPRHLREAARHALIVLVGGKRLIIHVDSGKMSDGFIPGRVYLAEKVYDVPDGMATPYGLEDELLEVSLFYRWLVSRDFNMDYVKAVLNGRGR